MPYTGIYNKALNTLNRANRGLHQIMVDNDMQEHLDSIGNLEQVIEQSERLPGLDDKEARRIADRLGHQDVRIKLSDYNPRGAFTLPNNGRPVVNIGKQNNSNNIAMLMHELGHADHFKRLPDPNTATTDNIRYNWMHMIRPWKPLEDPAASISGAFGNTIKSLGRWNMRQQIRNQMYKDEANASNYAMGQLYRSYPWYAKPAYDVLKSAYSTYDPRGLGPGLKPYDRPAVAKAAYGSPYPGHYAATDRAFYVDPYGSSPKRAENRVLPQPGKYGSTNPATYGNPNPQNWIKINKQ